MLFHLSAVLCCAEVVLEAELGGAEEQATLEGGTSGEELWVWVACIHGKLAAPGAAKSRPMWLSCEQGLESCLLHAFTPLLCCTLAGEADPAGAEQALGSPQQAAVAEEDAGQMEAEPLAADASRAASEPLAADSAAAPAANKQPAPAQPDEESEVVGSASQPGASPPKAAGEAAEVAQVVEEPQHLTNSPPLPASPSKGSPAPSSPGAAVPALDSSLAHAEAPADECQSLAVSEPAAAASPAPHADQGGLSSAAEARGSKAPPTGLDGEQQRAASTPVAEEQVPSPASPAAASGAEAAAGAAVAVQEAAAAAAVVVQEAEVAEGEDIDMMDVDAGGSGGLNYG